MTKATTLREMLASDRPVLAAGAHNGIGAVIAERAGYQAVWASGLEISAAHGIPDAGLLGMTDFLDAARIMDQACGIPIIADCDTGFGGQANAAFTLRSYEAAGVAAVCFEDKVFPKVNSFADEGRQLLVDVEEFCRKIRAAKSVQLNPDTILIARTEALIAGDSMEHALERAHAYADAGADMILIHSKRSTPDQVVEFMEKWANRLPVAIVPTTYPGWSAEDAYRAGASLIIHANQGLRASVAAMQSTFAAMVAAGSPAPVEDQIATVKEIFELQRMDYWLELGA